jgi:hypothetical protein
MFVGTNERSGAATETGWLVNTFYIHGTVHMHTKLGPLGRLSVQPCHPRARAKEATIEGSTIK